MLHRPWPLSVRARRARAVNFAVALSSWVALPATAETSTDRYLCVVADGSPQLFTVDLSLAFPLAVAPCTRTDAPRERASTPAARPAPMDMVVIGSTAPQPSTEGRPAPSLPAPPQAFAQQIDAASRRQQLDPVLVRALIQTESGFRRDAVSPRGALGLMQVMPATGRRYGVDSPEQLLDPAINIDVGTRYLRDLSVQFGARADLVLAAYNAGEGAVVRYGYRVPPFAETQAYVAKIASLIARSADRR